jgi:exonuclease VII large subunit
MALVRGGGGGIEAADDLLVLETITQLKTPLICAIGHVDEKLFIKNIADKVAPTPNGLGSYFSEMVELVAEKRNKSRAVLVEEVKKQFKEQLETAEKQNKELQNRFTALTKNQEEATKMHNEQVEAATKQNKELQGQLAFLNKSAETLQKEHAKQMEALQLQLKSLKEQNDKQAKDFNENIGKMQKTNSELQQSLNRLNAQNVQSAIDLAEAKAKAVELQRQINESKKGCASGCLGMLIAIVSVIGVVCWGVMMIVFN